MPIFKPTLYIHSATQITPQWCKKNNIKGIILDTDNTLSVHGSQIAADGIVNWLEQLKHNNIKLVILSNNSKERIEPFAKALRLAFVYNGAKPLKRGYEKSLEFLGCKKEETIIIGDQVFTDILGGNLFKIKTILCKPIEPESGIFFKLKRKAEKPFIKKLDKKEEIL